MVKSWYIVVGDEKFGPFSAKQFSLRRQGELNQPIE